MSLYTSIHEMKKELMWGFSEVLDMPPIDWEIFNLMHLNDKNKG